MAVRLVFVINSNSKILQTEHCLCLKDVMIYRPDLWNLLIQVNYWEGNW